MGKGDRTREERTTLDRTLAEVEAQAIPGLPKYHRVALEELTRHVISVHGCGRANTWTEAHIRAALAAVVKEHEEKAARISTLGGRPPIDVTDVDHGEALLSAGVWEELQRDHAAHHDRRWTASDHPMDLDSPGLWAPLGLHGADQVFMGELYPEGHPAHDQEEDHANGTEA